MKKLILSIIAAAAIAPAAGAQSYLTENPDNKAYFGARIGIDVSSTAGQPTNVFSNGAGFSIGGIYNIPLVMNAYFEPGLSLFYDTFGTTITTTQEFPSGAYTYEINGSIRNFGFRIPFNFGYHFDFTDEISVHLFTGPVLNLNLLARQYYPADKDADFEKQNYSILGSGGFKHCDLQWDFGVAVTYNHYYVSIGGGVGITKAYDLKINKPVSNEEIYRESFRRNIFNISLGYNF